MSPDPPASGGAEAEKKVLLALQRAETRGVVAGQGRTRRRKLREFLRAAVDRRALDPSAMVLFTRQLATLVGSGIPLAQGISVLATQAESRGERRVCERILKALESGRSLSSAMRETGAFPPLYLRLVEAGETTGDLDLALERLAEHIEARQETRNAIRAALTYPVISLGLVLAITAYLLVFILPAFRDTFADLGSELPALTRVVLDASDRLREAWVELLLGTAGGIALLYLATRTRRGSWWRDWLLLRLPIVGPVVHRTILARFARTFAKLQSSAVPILAALDVAAESAGNELVARDVRASREAVAGGSSLSSELAKSPHFPAMAVQMVAVGERSGALDRLLEKVADYYDGQARAATKTLSELAMPLSLVVLGTVVGTVLLAIFLALFELIQLGG